MEEGGGNRLAGDDPAAAETERPLRDAPQMRKVMSRVRRHALDDPVIKAAQVRIRGQRSSYCSAVMHLKPPPNPRLPAQEASCRLHDDVGHLRGASRGKSSHVV